MVPIARSLSSSFTRRETVVNRAAHAVQTAVGGIVNLNFDSGVDKIFIVAGAEKYAAVGTLFDFEFKI